MGKKPASPAKETPRRPVRRAKGRGKKRAILWGVPLVFALLFLFCIQLYRVPSRAMENTLRAGDYLLLEKLSYGARLPGLNISMPGVGSVAAGDLVVFHLPEDPQRVYVKRCLATEGQVVEIVDKAVYVDGIRVPDPPHSKYIDAHLIPGRSGTRDNLSPMEVPSGHVFLIGDNRDNSRDSRHWGSIPLESITGRAISVVFSLEAKAEEEAGLLPFSVRWSRLGAWLH